MKRLKHLSAGQQVSFIVGTLCAILVIIGGLFFFSLRSIERRTRLEQSHALNKLALIDDGAQDIGVIQAEVLWHILSSDPEEIKGIDRSLSGNRETNTAELVDYQNYVGTEKERKLYDRVMRAHKAYWEQTEPVLLLSRANRDAEATKLVNATQDDAYDEFLDAINDLIKEVEVEARETSGATSGLIAKIRIIGNILVAVAILIAMGAGYAIAGIAHRLREGNQVLQTEIKERRQAETELNEKTAFLEAQVNSSIDGILVVDERGKKTLQNPRVAELLKIPRHIADDQDDGTQFRWVAEMSKDPADFLRSSGYLNAHPDEIGRDELELKDGTVLDRYSAPVMGKDGKYYGRIWTFREITERKRAESITLAYSKLGQRLSGAKSAREAFGIISEVSGDLFGWDAFWINLYRVEDDSIYSGYAVDIINGQRVADESNEPRKPSELNRRIIKRGSELILRELPTAALPGSIPFGDTTRPSVSLMFVPIRSRDQTVGILSVQSYTTNAYNKRDLATLQTLADQCGGAFERIWADEAQLKSESQFRLVWNASSDGMRLTNRDGLVLTVNDAYCQMVGKTKAELEGQLFSIIQQEENAGHALRRHRERIDSNTIPPRLEKEVTLWDGRQIWFELCNSMMQLPGQPFLVLSIFRDITARKLADESLRLLGSAVEQAKESIVITDAGLDLPGPRVIFINPAFTKMTGYTAEETIGKTPRILQGANTDRAVLDRLRRNLARGEVFQGEAINYRKDGGEFMLEWQIAPLRNESGKITNFVAIQRDITERKLAENALRESNEKFHQLADNIADAFWIRSPDMQEVQYISPAFERIWGRSVQSLYENPHQWADFIFPEDHERVVNAFAGLAGKVQSLDIEYRIVRPDGEIRWVRVRGFQVRTAGNKLIRHTGIVTDITDRKRFEAQLLQSQKMETVGKLAGGIAHEFNSILTAIIGQSELLLADLPVESPQVKNATEIRKAAARAATLTRQLLAYSRKQILRPEILDLNSVLAGMESTLRHLMGRSTDLRIVPAAGLKAVKADAGQIEQVIINLVMNAADAMPKGGRLTLETSNVTLDRDYVSSVPELQAGEYVMLAATDTGGGMNDEVKERVFEPFFSTKGIGEGTGLGLSTSYGIIKQSGGHISVYSELARGTSFKIYLPQVEKQAAPLIRRDAPELPRGTETILLVEDDPALREMAATLLSRLGYTLFTAANGIEALGIKQQTDIGHIDLLFTDVVMPHMSGKELADRVRVLSPHTRILFTSAYTENSIVHQGVLDRGVALLQKPFTPSALAHKLREVLDEPDVPKPGVTQKTFGFTEIPYKENIPKGDS